MQYNVIRANTMQYSTIQFNSIQANTLKYNTYLLISFARSVRQVMDRVYFLHFMKTGKEGKNEDPQLAARTEQTRLVRCLLYGFVDYSGKGTKSSDILAGDQELEVRTAGYLRA